jgi:putative transposase
MARKRREPKPLATIWRVGDELWAAVIQPVLAELDPPAKGHRPRVDQRKALDGIIYHLRTGCQWEALPKEFGDDSSVHRTKQRWVRRGVFDRVWAVLVEACGDLAGVEWAWQSFDCATGKARHGGIESDRTRPTGPSPARSGAC